MKILNLYAGIGGNRKLWGDEHEITAVEIDPNIAKIYQDFFPDDRMIVGDAHQYLELNYGGYDFIWSSPPCPTHSRIRNIAGVGCGQNAPCYPDMKLYEEIIFLRQIYKSNGVSFSGKYVVENVRGYYKPLIQCQEVGLHYYWANFYISPFHIKTRGHMTGVGGLQERKGIDLTEYNLLSFKKQEVLRNFVEPELGLHILNESQKGEQGVLFGGD